MLRRVLPSYCFCATRLPLQRSSEEPVHEEKVQMRRAPTRLLKRSTNRTTMLRLHICERYKNCPGGCESPNRSLPARSTSNVMIILLCALPMNNLHGYEMFEMFVFVLYRRSHLTEKGESYPCGRRDSGTRLRSLHCRRCQAAIEVTGQHQPTSKRYGLRSA